MGSKHVQEQIEILYEHVARGHVDRQFIKIHALQLLYFLEDGEHALTDPSTTDVEMSLSRDLVEMPSDVLGNSNGPRLH